MPGESMAITPRNQRQQRPAATCSSRNLGKTTVTWTGPSCLREKRSWGGILASVTCWVRLRVREGEREPGWASWAGSVDGLKPWRWPFSFSLFLFYFWFDFLEWFSNDFKLYLNSNLFRIFAVCNSHKYGHKTKWSLCIGLVIWNKIKITVT